MARRDLGNRASPINRAHMKRPLVLNNQSLSRILCFKSSFVTIPLCFSLFFFVQPPTKVCIANRNIGQKLFFVFLKKKKQTNSPKLPLVLNNQSLSRILCFKSSFVTIPLCFSLFFFVQPPTKVCIANRNIGQKLFFVFFFLKKKQTNIFQLF